MYFYIPNTLTPKNTWQDSGLTILNTNPVNLDAAGRAVIWGSGSYRQIVKDAVGNTIWDQVTSDSSQAATDLAANLANETDIAKGASLIGYLPPFSGAFGRTQSEKNQDSVSVGDFRAIGNGIVDDASGIQSALNSGAKYITLIAGKTYKINSGLVVPAGVTIYAFGATIDASAGNFTAFTLGSGASFFGGTINGPGNSSYNASSNAISASGTNNSPSAPTYIVGPTIRNVTINGFGSYGIYCRYCLRPDIRENYITNIGYAAVLLASCTDGVVDGNTIYGVSPGTASNDYGISVTREVSALGDITVNPRSKDCRVTNNRIDGVLLWEAIDSHAADGILISGNTITNSAYGISCVPSHFGADDDYASSRLVISDNTITLTSGTGNGITVAGAYTGGGVLSDYSDTVVIKGNNISGAGISGSAINGGIKLYGVKTATVNGNTVKNSRVNGILLYQDVQWANVTGNTITDPYDNTQVGSCVKQTGNNVVALISGNTFVRSNTGLGTNVANSSVRFTGSATGCQISVGKNIYSGITASFLTFANENLAYVDVSQGASEKGQASISLVSGQASNLVDIAFTNVFPSTNPKINAFISSAINVGGKAPIFRITNITSSGFRIIAFPYDNTTWSASGTLTVEWFATT